MAVCGIITEFDPFHNGHQYLIDTVRREFAPRAVVCVMSGQFTQRGEPAILDKFTRARLAVMGGADLVIELPACCAVNGAREFAFGGVRTLGLLGVVSHVAFGSETGDLPLLEKAADVSLREDGALREALRTEMEAGRSFGTAYARALNAAVRPQTDSLEGFPGSNDILALEYVKQLKTAGFSMKPFAVRREGAGHREEEPDDRFASGRRIRAILEAGEPVEAAAPYVPSFTLAALQGRQSLALMQARMLDLLRYVIPQTPAERIASAPAVSEGLENVIRREVRKAADYDDLVERVRSRRYPAGRVRRALLQVLLGMEKDCLDKLSRQPSYVRVLAFNETGAGLIAEAREKGAAAIVVNPGKADWGESGAPSGLQLDMRASEVYGTLCGKSPYNSSDLVNIPKMLRNS
ncbi:MAG: nucleotidyltransferase family protein [Clostridia bacterium]|nr:nucleotidyltransferase family protein [Clostridia bacterium]